MPLTKAIIINTDKKEFEPITVMFNPPSLKVKSSNSYADPKIPGGAQDQQQFIKKDTDVLTVEFFFDTTRDGSDVSSAVNPILELAKVSKEKKEPPKLIFAWGDFNFPSIITSIDQTYDYFNSEGHALRATLVVTFLRCEPDNTSVQTTQAKSAAPKAKPSIQVQAKQTLSDIAVCVCNDPAKWREIAEANSIDNPLLFNNGDMVGKLISSI
ncbi:MAG: hypothetical protein FWE97_03555 [Dehalococcoidia bacterium]|nr:hypothetical protein [Dehalococcoidia bacterium]